MPQITSNSIVIGKNGGTKAAGKRAANGQMGATSTTTVYSEWPGPFTLISGNNYQLVAGNYSFIDGFKIPADITAFLNPGVYIKVGDGRGKINNLGTLVIVQYAVDPDTPYAEINGRTVNPTCDGFADENPPNYSKEIPEIKC